MKKWLSVQECAEHLSISEHTVYQYVSKRKIPFSKIPGSNLVRFDIEQIDAWLENAMIKTATDTLKGED